MLHKQELIDNLIPILHKIGYKKRRNTWIKHNPDTITVFNIQGSQYDKDFYYINLGICIKELLDSPTKISDCHFYERIDEKTTRRIDDIEVIIKLIELWDQRYDSVDKLKEKQYAHQLPKFCDSNAVSYLLCGIKR